MALIELTNMIEGSIGVHTSAGAPSAGTNEVQTLTIGGTPTGGTYKLALDGVQTAAVTWSATNGTLLSNLNTALDGLSNGGASAIVATAGTLTAGIGTVLLTFSGSPLSKKAVNTMTVANNSLTGSAPTLAIAETTPGVDATARGAVRGAILSDTTNGKLYITTSANPPTWVVVGSQS
jgi:hypothetical protein